MEALTKFSVSLKSSPDRQAYRLHQRINLAHVGRADERPRRYTVGPDFLPQADFAFGAYNPREANNFTLYGVFQLP